MIGRIDIPAVVAEAADRQIGIVAGRTPLQGLTAVTDANSYIAGGIDGVDRELKIVLAAGVRRYGARNGVCGRSGIARGCDQIAARQCIARAQMR